jgi:hypothetical protein
MNKELFYFVPTEVSMNLKMTRFVSGMSQAELFKKSGVYMSRISQFEKHGIQLNPSEKAKIEAVLGTIDWESPQKRTRTRKGGTNV